MCNLKVSVKFAQTAPQNFNYFSNLLADWLVGDGWRW